MDAEVLQRCGRVTSGGVSRKPTWPEGFTGSTFGRQRARSSKQNIGLWTLDDHFTLPGIAELP